MSPRAGGFRSPQVSVTVSPRRVAGELLSPFCPDPVIFSQDRIGRILVLHSRLGNLFWNSLLIGFIQTCTDGSSVRSHEQGSGGQAWPESDLAARPAAWFGVLRNVLFTGRLRLRQTALAQLGRVLEPRARRAELEGGPRSGSEMDVSPLQGLAGHTLNPRSQALSLHVLG